PRLAIPRALGPVAAHGAVLRARPDRPDRPPGRRRAVVAGEPARGLVSAEPRPAEPLAGQLAGDVLGARDGGRGGRQFDDRADRDRPLRRPGAADRLRAWTAGGAVPAGDRVPRARA